jgi:hypothetical protein
MVEVTHIACRELLHKHGLLPVADILEKYGIASVIDVSELKQDDFIALEDLGLKPFMLMKIKRWSTSGGVLCSKLQGCTVESRQTAQTSTTSCRG